MEQVRNAKLDRICESIGEERDQMNRARTEEKSLTQAAMQQMNRGNVTIYRHAGVELALVPGAQKLRVRLTKDDGDAETAAPASAMDEALGAGGEPGSDGAGIDGGDE